jgi:simple sugar transport system substrate-binding protein
VISMNSGSDVREELGVAVHVGQTEYEAGEGGGKQMAEAGVTQAICVNQEVGNVALDLRCEGFTDGLGGTVEVLSVSMDPTEIGNAVKAYLSANPDTDGVLTLGPSAAEPTMAALEEVEMLDQVTFGTFDLSPGVLEAIDQGRMMFAIDQQQYLQGYLPIELLKLYHLYGLMPAGTVMTGPGFVTQDNAAQVIDLSAKGIR